MVSFSRYRLVELSDAQAFQQQAGAWLALREAENCYILGELPRAAAAERASRARFARYFVLTERDQITAAVVVFSAGGAVMTWASAEMITAIAEQLSRTGCVMTAVLAPAHVAAQFSKAWCAAVGGQWDLARDERVYQLIRVRHDPSGGTLRPAEPQDETLLTAWMDGFSREAELQGADEAGATGQLVRELTAQGRLYVWCAPAPVAMAAWVSPTPNGGSINLVYVPPEVRGRGYGKDVVAALAKHILAGGARYCFILTDTKDRRTNQLYQRVGARTVAELVQATIQPAQPAARQAGGLVVSIGGR